MTRDQSDLHFNPKPAFIAPLLLRTGGRAGGRREPQRVPTPPKKSRAKILADNIKYRNAMEDFIQGMDNRLGPASTVVFNEEDTTQSTTIRDPNTGAIVLRVHDPRDDGWAEMTSYNGVPVPPKLTGAMTTTTKSTPTTTTTTTPSGRSQTRRTGSGSRQLYIDYQYGGFYNVPRQ